MEKLFSWTKEERQARAKRESEQLLAQHALETKRDSLLAANKVFKL